MNIVGISTHRRGSTACLVREGRVVAAAREEWFTRTKGDNSFPEHALEFCLESAGLAPTDVDAVAYAMAEGRVPVLQSWLAPLARRSGRIPVLGGGGGPGWAIRSSLRQRVRIECDTCLVDDFHAAAASAYLQSPFERAAVLVVNGPGTEPGSAYGIAEGSRIESLGQTPSPHSVGTVITAIAHRMGLSEPWQEDELTDLAPLGRPRFTDAIRRDLVEFGDDGFCRVRDDGVASSGLLDRLYGRVYDLIGERIPEHRRSHREMDVARSIQSVAEHAVLHAAQHLHKVTGARALAFGGELALNPAVVGALVREGPFESVWVPPSPADTAVGCALHVWHEVLRHSRDASACGGQRCHVGPTFSEEALRAYLEVARIPCERMEAEGLCERVAGVLTEGVAVGWFQGPMALGQHGLGARCILADPRQDGMRAWLNEHVKRRAAFRSLGASVPEERAGDYFKGGSSPFMLMAQPLSRAHSRPLKRREKKLRGLERLDVGRSDLPALARADGTVRVHTVDASDDPRLHGLLRAFEARTGCGVLINASLDVEGQPIVASPRDAYALFMQSGLSYLAMGPFLIDKRQQPLWEDVEGVV